MIPFEPLPVGTAAFHADPWPAYARLRAERPLCRVRLPSGEEAVLATRHADVAALLKDARLAKDPANARTPATLTRTRRPPRMLRPLTRNLLALDDPDHARLKRLVQAAFTPRRVEALREQTEAVSTQLLDALSRRTRFDLVKEYALPLPVTVISELLGVPARDRTRFAHWSRTLIRAGTTPLRLALALPHMTGFLRYLRRLIATKRTEGGDDLVSALVRDEAAGKLDGEELMALVAILVSAGHETTTNLIGNGLLALLQHPGERERLTADSALIGSAVEELLRFAGPVEMSTPRFAREGLEIAGTPVPRGAQVFGVIASANRDPARFAEPDRLDLGRAPNRHLTFGEGGHHCVGAALARLEARVAFADLLRRLPHLRLAVPAERLRWRPHHILRGLTHLPVWVAGRRAGD